MVDYITRIDFGILDWIAENFQCGFMDVFMRLITLLGENGIVCIVGALALLIFKKTRKIGIAMSIAMILGLLVCNLALKPLVARIRPYDINTSIELIIDRLTDYSFPSGHTICVFEVSTVLRIYNRKVGTVAYVLAFLVAFSRLYLYVHYPSDVLSSIMLGILFGFLGWFITGKIFKVLEKRKGEQKL